MNNVTLERQLAKLAGVYAAVEDRDGRLFVTGQIGLLGRVHLGT